MMRHTLRYLLPLQESEPRSFKRKFYRNAENKYAKLHHDLTGRCPNGGDKRCQGAVFLGIDTCIYCYAKDRMKEHGKKLWRVGSKRPPKGSRRRVIEEKSGP